MSGAGSPRISAKAPMVIRTDWRLSFFFFWLGLIFFFRFFFPEDPEVGAPGSLTSGLFIGFILSGLDFSNVEQFEISERSDS